MMASDPRAMRRRLEVWTRGQASWPVSEITGGVSILDGMRSCLQVGSIRRCAPRAVPRRHLPFYSYRGLSLPMDKLGSPSLEGVCMRIFRIWLM